MAELFQMINNKEKADNYTTISEKIKSAIPDLFLDKRGMLLASTGKSGQPDVWSTALAVYLNILDVETYEKTCRFLARAYSEGTLSYKGNIRHVLDIDDYNDSTAWEVTDVRKNSYQNGAYWGTPTGWVCYAIAKVDYRLARKLAGEYIADLRTNDYRRGEEYGAPFECFYPSTYEQNPVYLTTVTCPYIVFQSMKK